MVTNYLTTIVQTLTTNSNLKVNNIKELLRGFFFCGLIINVRAIHKRVVLNICHKIWATEQNELVLLVMSLKGNIYY